MQSLRMISFNRNVFKCHNLRLLSSMVSIENHNDGSVQRLLLNNTKKRNALSLSMLQELNKTFETIEKRLQCLTLNINNKDDAHNENISDYNKQENQQQQQQQQLIRALIISSNCDKIFSSGHDLRELAENDVNYRRKIFDECTKLMLRIRDLPIPVICQVDGLATAAGCQFVSSCDIVLATKRSTFSTPGASVGLFCSTPGIAVARSVHHRMAAYMLLTGLSINANEALISGLITSLCEDLNDMNEQTNSIIESISMKPAAVIALGKKFMYRQMQMNNLSEAYGEASKIMVNNLSMKDCQEGMNAFLQKRRPKWTHSNE